MQSTQPQRLLRLTIMGAILVGTGLLVVGSIIENDSLIIAGSLLAGGGFIATGAAHITKQRWIRSSDGRHTPSWAAAILILGGVVFLMGAVAQLL